MILVNKTPYNLNPQPSVQSLMSTTILASLMGSELRGQKGVSKATELFKH